MEDVRMSQPHAGHVHMACLPIRSLGLTLPELLVSLSVTSIMTFAALNNLPQLIQSNRMTGEVNRFVAALQLNH
jgi:Tfp pilus assembly protein FimT